MNWIQVLLGGLIGSVLTMIAGALIIDRVKYGCWIWQDDRDQDGMA